MLQITKLQILAGLQDAKFLFVSLIVLIAFLLNGITFSDRYQREYEDYRTATAETYRLMEPACENLQELSIFEQAVYLPPNKLSFISSGGQRYLPNGIVQNAFSQYEIGKRNRDNAAIETLPELDWVFIVGFLCSLLVVIASYNAIAEERRDGTLRLVLSYPLSRLKLFLGKFFGLLAVLLTTFFAGIVLDLTVIMLSGGPALESTDLLILGYAVLFSIAFLVSILFLSMAVSTLTRRPSVALVSLLALWVFAVVAVPGMSRIIVEQINPVIAEIDVQNAYEDALDEVRENAPPGYSDWNGNPFASFVKHRAEFRTTIYEMERKFFNPYEQSKINQFLLSQRGAAVMPYGLLNDALQQLNTSGVYAYIKLREGAERYRNILLEFIKAEDAEENDTPHLVYGLRNRYDPGVFSNKAVLFTAVPKAEEVWSAMRSGHTPGIPLWYWVSISGFIVTFGLIAFFALMRLDPR